MDSDNSHCSHNACEPEHSTTLSGGTIASALRVRSARILVLGVIVAVVTGSVLFIRGVPLAIAVLAAMAFAFFAVNAAIDAVTMKLVPLWTHCGTALAMVAAGVFLVDGQWQRVLTAAGCACALGAVALLVTILNPRAFGRGDARLIGALSAWVALFDPFSLVGMLLIASCAQLGAFGLTYKRSRLNNNGVMPFGPSLVFGAWCACVIALPPTVSVLPL